MFLDMWKYDGGGAYNFDPNAVLFELSVQNLALLNSLLIYL